MMNFSRELSSLRVDEFDLGTELASNETTIRASHAKGVLTREFLLHGKLNLLSLYLVVAGCIAALVIAGDHLASHITIGASIVFVLSIRRMLAPHYVRWLLSWNPVLSEHRLTLYERGIESLSNGGIARVAYDWFEGVTSEGRQVRLISKLTGEPSLMIIKDGFKSNDDYDQFVGLLRQKIESAQHLNSNQVSSPSEIY